MALQGNIQTLVQTGAGNNTLTQQQRIFYEGMLIKNLLPFLDFVGLGQKGTVPRNSGGWSSSSIKWRKRAVPYTLPTDAANLSFLGAAATALTEGVPPDFIDVTWSEVTTQLAQYGNALKHSDLISHAGIDDNVAHFASALGEVAGMVLNFLVVNELAGGTNVQYQGSNVNRAAIGAGENIDNTEIKKAVRTLELAFVPKFPSGMYKAVMHVRQGYDLRGDSVWQAMNGQNGYKGQDGLRTGDLGQLHGADLSTSVTTPIWASTVTVYGAFVMGPDGFGVRDFAAWKVPAIDPATGKGIRIMYVPADQPSRDDPLGQFGTMGYKFAFVVKILDQARMVRIESAAS